MDDLKIIWLFCWKKSPFKKYIDKNITKEITNFIPLCYFYTFTDCANLSGGHIADRRYNSQLDLDEALLKNHHLDHNYARHSLLAWYVSNCSMEFDKLYRSKYMANEYCCSICVLKTYKTAIKSPYGYYEVPVDDDQWDKFWIWRAN